MNSQLTFGNTSFHPRITQILVIILWLAISCFLLNALITGQISNFVIIAAGIALLFWMFFAHDAWWILLPITLSFGGVFVFGFKIYTYELGLALCLLPLIITLAISRVKKEKRAPLPRSAYVLLGYMLIHFVVSIYLLKIERITGAGNVLRVYMRGIWPLAFLFPFYFFGKTKYLKHAFWAMYLAVFIRTSLGIIGYYFPHLLYIPGINFILPGTAGMDLRSSALALALFSVCLACMSKRLIAVVFHVCVIALSGWFVLLGGSRVSFGMFCVIPPFCALIYRKFILLGILAVAFLSIIITVNKNPEALYKLPYRASRALSIMVLKTPYHHIHKELEGSNKWHFGLQDKGEEKWGKSFLSFLVGNRVFPFSEDFRARTATFEKRKQIAADMGAYESGLWSVFGVLGITGGILYILIFYGLLRNIVPALFKDGIYDYQHVFYFLATSGIFIWLIFSWIAGGFPSYEMMLAVIAKAAYEDAKQEKNGSSKESVGKNREEFTTENSPQSMIRSDDTVM